MSIPTSDEKASKNDPKRKRSSHSALADTATLLKKSVSKTLVLGMQ
jgi:hypothetical protein